MDQCIPDTAMVSETLVELLHLSALQKGDQPAYIFLSDGEKNTLSISYKELDRQARSIAVLLRQFGAPGDRALLLFQPGLDYIAAFFGCLYAGFVALPAYLPRSFKQDKMLLRRLRTVAEDARPVVALTTVQSYPAINTSMAQISEFQGIQLLAVDERILHLAERWLPPTLNKNDLAFLQYTSGSTATPKGVMVTHENLIRNSAQIYRCFEITPESLGVSWLPPYHDMGLIGGIVQSVYSGCTSVLMSPVSFLQKPYRWLRAISEYKATTSGAPNFAYDLCARKITAEQRAQLDLSSWKVAFTGAEPIRTETLERFATTFAACGFRSEAFLPCYGLAEATLIVSGSKTAGPVVGTFQAYALHYNRVIEDNNPGKHQRTLVSCGSAVYDQEIAIVNPETRESCARDEIGEVWVSGPNMAAGYWNKKEATEYTFQAFIKNTGDGPFMRTGDLGFLQDGQLFITGRLKDLIIILGRNYYPQDIELSVEKCHPALRSGCGAAFAIEMQGQERLIVVQEVEHQYRTLDVEQVVATIRQAVAEEHELQVHDVVLLKAGYIPKTSSGKVQRHMCHTKYIESTLDVFIS